jgi:phospholipid/cholesterol/gamma-HCH transport system substrate-binding protein
MDKTHRKNILLGLFVSLGIVLFIFGIFQIGMRKEMFKKTFLISANFRNTTGLKSGSNVRFNGVKVGIVKAVSLTNDSTVRVDMQIEESKHAFIFKNAVAAISSDGLMGDKLINLTSGKGNSVRAENNDIITGRDPLVTDEVMQTLNATNENVKVISDNLKVLTTNLNSENGTIQVLYKDPEMANNLKSSFNNLNQLTGKVLAVSTSLQQITTQIQNGDGALGEVLYDTTLGNDLSHTLSKLKETSDELNMVSGQLSVTMKNVNSGKGAVNLILTDTAFSSNIQQSLLNIKSASRSMDQDMEALKHNFLLRSYFRKQERKNRNK